MPHQADRFSRLAFGGGEAGEAAAQAALVAHEATLVPGARVRVYRGEPAGLVGVVLGDGPGRTIRVDAGDGLTWTLETRNVELVARHGNPGTDWALFSNPLAARR